MEAFWGTDTWTTNQFQAFLVWCRRLKQVPCERAVLKFAKTDEFRQA